MPARASSRSLLLLGERHTTFGDCAVAVLAGGRTAGAISVGGDYVRMWKSELSVPNEDCAFVCEDAQRTLMLVCDGHSGYHASHALAKAFADCMAQRDVPDSPEQLAKLVESVVRTASRDQGDDPGVEVTDSASTMIVAVVDRPQRRLFGLCSGDSSAVVLPDGGRGVSCVEKADDYVVPWRPEMFAAWPPRTFSWSAQPGDLVLLYSDGVDECHRGRPESSIQLRHLEQLRTRDPAAGPGPDPDAEAYAEQLVLLALRGVDGHPGGQDNVVALVTHG